MVLSASAFAGLRCRSGEQCHVPDVDKEQPSHQGPYDIREEPVQSADQLEHAYVRRLYDWWIAANEGATPRRSQLDIAEHTMLASNTFLVERCDAQSFRFKLHGEAAMDITGMRDAQTEVSEQTESHFNTALFRYYCDVVKNAIPVRCTGSLAFADQPHRRFESIDCPLTDEAGNMAYIIGVIVVRPQRR